MIYHRGYIKCNGKRSVDKFKDVPDEGLRTLAQAKTFESYAGVLAPGVVLLDFDIREHSEIAYDIIADMGLNCRIYQSNKGYHFLFKASDKFDKSSTRVRLACGITCDIKLGTKNSYEVLKLRGEEREMIQDSDEPDVVPAFLSPLDSDVQLVGLHEGDCRNDVLYKYILKLQGAKFTREECLETLAVINKYVFGEPLPESEFRVICREEAFKDEREIKPAFFDEKGRFKHWVFAEYLANNMNIIKIDGVLHIYKDGIYVRSSEDVERAMVKEIPMLTDSKRKEVYKYIDLLVYENHTMADPRYMAFKNGVYDIVTDTLLPFSPEYTLVNKTPHDYNPNARDETIIKVMNNLACGKKELFDLLCEMVGYMFWRTNELGWSFFCLGNRANGKSTFLDTLGYLLGNENTSALDIKELNKDFKSQELFGKQANLGDDIDDDYIRDVSVFKKLATGNPITANPKYEKPFVFRNYAKLIFSANVMPRLNDRTNAAARRIVPIPFKATFDKNSPDFDPFIKYKIQTPEAMSTLINLGLEGLKRVLINNDFTRCEEVNAEIRAIEENNNPLLVFIKTHRLENQLINECYSSYIWWASNSGTQAMSRQTFVKQIETNLGLIPQTTNVDGKDIELFVKEVVN